MIGRTGREGTNYVGPLLPLFLRFHLSDHPLRMSSSPSGSLALHLLAEHAGHGDIERGIERWMQRGRESDGENIDSPVLVCSAPEPQGYGTGDGEGARREGVRREALLEGGRRQGWRRVRVRGRGVQRGS